MCHTKNLLCNSNLLVSVSKFDIDKYRYLVSYRYRNLASIPLKIVGIVSVSYRFEKAGITHPYYKNNWKRLEVERHFASKVVTKLSFQSNKEFTEDR